MSVGAYLKKLEKAKTISLTSEKSIELAYKGSGVHFVRTGHFIQNFWIRMPDPIKAVQQVEVSARSMLSKVKTHPGKTVAYQYDRNVFIFSHNLHNNAVVAKTCFVLSKDDKEVDDIKCDVLIRF